MKKYIIHVVDESSCHEKDNSEILESFSRETEENCNVLRTDGMYCVFADTEEEAAVFVSSKLTLKDSNDEERKLSELIMEEKKSSENAEIGSENFDIFSFNPLNYSNNSNSKVILIPFKIDRENKEKSWYEFHNVFFYITEEDNIMMFD